MPDATGRTRVPLRRLTKRQATILALTTTAILSALPSAASAYYERFWGPANCSLVCPDSGSARHTWGYVGTALYSGATGTSLCERDWRDYTGTTLSYRCSTGVGVDSYTDLNSYCSAGYLQRAVVENHSTVSRNLYGDAWTQNYYGTPCN